VSPKTTAAPAFGAANLSNCEREQIHLAGCIQPHGALLTVREDGQTILQASANARDFLRVGQRLQGLPIKALGGDLSKRLRELPDNPEVIPYVVRCHLADETRPMNALLHRSSAGEVVVEIEDSGPSSDASAELERAMQAITGAGSLACLGEESARIFKEITGYDRVMIYRFDEEGHGEVFAETRKPELEAFLGNRYPASDIPQIARRLYVRNRVRLLADVDYAPSPIEPRFSPLTGQDLDMSMCFLRSASPIHIQYLQNMGVSATLVVSLMVGDRLWGLVSCHHYSPRYLHFEMRAICELLGEAIGTRIAALESFTRGQAELAVRRLEQRMAESVSRDGDWRGALFDSARSLLLPLQASGAALLFEGQVQSTGQVPGTEEIRALADWLLPRLENGLFATSSLGAQAPDFAMLARVAAGVIAVRVSGAGEELLMWFREERVRTITWGGDPSKSMLNSDDPRELSPRRSFAQWQQIVQGASDPWTPAHIATARMIGASVTDVILQFRAVQVVIATDQLDQVSRQVQASEQQVVVADASGAILESNAAFERMIGAPAGALGRLDDLPRYFADSADFELKLEALRLLKRGWRGEIALRAQNGPGRPLHVRADAVTSADERALGFVLMFTDLTERRAAELARRRFQETILSSHRRLSARLKTSSDVKAQALISHVVENAQLAALEVTDAAEYENMRLLLDGIRSSVERSAEVLERLSFGPHERTKPPGSHA
jgi:light-regulated signal transduction histidine kinase (bacteriophytochrome)